MDDWKPIESAPKDGTEIDVWTVRRSVRGLIDSNPARFTNVQWREVDGVDTWASYGDFRWNAVEYDFAGGAQIATHWMPLPTPPVGED